MAGFQRRGLTKKIQISILTALVTTFVSKWGHYLRGIWRVRLSVTLWRVH
jgi:hypothetical protein